MKTRADLAREQISLRLPTLGALALCFSTPVRTMEYSVMTLGSPKEQEWYKAGATVFKHRAHWSIGNE